MDNPALCVCCSECKSCFMAVTMEKDTMDTELWGDICEFVLEGSIIEVRESQDIRFKYCEHVKKLDSVKGKQQ